MALRVSSRALRRLAAAQQCRYLCAVTRQPSVKAQREPSNSSQIKRTPSRKTTISSSPDERTLKYVCKQLHYSGNGGIQIIHGDVSVAEAAKVFSESKAVTLSVTADNESLDGVLLQSDFVSKMPVDPTTATAKDIMTPLEELLILDAHTDIKEAMDSMAAKDVDHVLVAEDDDIISIVDTRSLALALLQDYSSDLSFLTDLFRNTAVTYNASLGDKLHIPDAISQSAGYKGRGI